MFQDLRFGLRMLIKHKGFTVISLLSLGLGIGANAAMFSLLNNALIRPLPFAEPEKLLRGNEWYPKGAIAALQEHSNSFEVAAFSTPAQVNVTGLGEAMRLTGSQVSANLFSLLKTTPRVGRVFEVGEDRPGRDGLVILSQALWQTRFGSDTSVIGRQLAVDGMPRQVIGVMPSEFGFPSSGVDVWIPARFDSSQKLGYWEQGWMTVIARMHPGVNIQQAQDELRTQIARIVPLFPFPMPPDWNATATLIPLQESLTRDFEGRLLLLLAAVVCVLLIACANVASLSLSRIAARQREIAVRCALGAGRGRIVRQFLTESVVLASTAGVLGLALASSSLTVLRSVLPLDNSLLVKAVIDWQVFAFVAGLAIITGIAFGLAPAISAARLDLSTALKTRTRQSGGLMGARIRSSLIVGEVTLAVALVVSAGLLIKSLWRLTQVDPGFNAKQIQTIRVFPKLEPGKERAAYISFYDELTARVNRVPGVTGVAAANTTPLSSELPALPVELEDHPVIPSQNLAPMFWAGAVTPGYFDILDIPLRSGRMLNEADTEDSPEVVLISEATVKQFWAGENCIGKRIRLAWESRWRTVVGVVGDVRQYNLAGSTPVWIQGAFYMPYSQSVGLDRQMPAAMTLIVNTAANSPQLRGALRRVVAGVNPDMPVGEVNSLEHVVLGSTSSSRSLMWLFVSFGGAALLLAAIGAYGVVSYSTAQRTYEMGVRIALGATRGQIFGIVLGQSFRLVLAGLGLGVIASLALTRLMTGLLYGVTATDPLTFFGVGLLLLATAMLAGYLPARRAASIDPLVALRQD
jgi:putative ABC transport system permease protein